MSKRKTHEEYVAEIALKNPNIEVLGIYIDSKTPVLHRCKIDNYEWYARPSKIIYGQGCPKCAGNIKKTTKEYIDEVALKNPTIEVVGEYRGANIKTKHHCLIHDIYWDACPTRILGGSGCCECMKEKIGFSNRKTHEQYVNEVREINPNIVVLGQYAGIDIPILHKCLKHNIEWMPHPITILNGGGCYECGIEKLKEQKIKTNEQYINELKLVNSNIIPLEPYLGALVPILHKCLIDGYEWRTTPANVLYGKGCPKCAGNAKKTHIEYVDEVAAINSDIEVVGEYINALTPILHRCKIDGCEWYTRPSDVLKGKGCPQCKQSKGEKSICLWLDGRNIEYMRQKTFIDCRDNKSLPFDFYLSKYNICIEYDGIQHFEPVDFSGKGKEWAKMQFEYTQRHDKIKTEYCQNNNIKLLRIAYFEDIEEKLNNFLFI